MRKALVAFLALGACAAPPGHEAFTQVMQRQVGKQADEPDFYPVYYRLPPLDSKRLANGNTEEKYRAGRRGECHLFFELTPGRRVVGWRAEGDDRECVIVSPRP